MVEYNFTTFDKQGARLVKVPELTIQAKGSMSMNAAAWNLMGQPVAVALMYDEAAKVIGLRPVPPEDPHAYPLRGVGGKKGVTPKLPNSFIVAGQAFVKHFGIPVGNPVRRQVTVVDGVLIVDLNDPGRLAASNRNRSRTRAVQSAEKPLTEKGEGLFD